MGALYTTDADPRSSLALKLSIGFNNLFFLSFIYIYIITYLFRFVNIILLILRDFLRAREKLVHTEPICICNKDARKCF